MRRYRVLRTTDDPNYVVIDLEFDEASEAQAYLAALQRVVYSSWEASSTIGDGPQTRIAEVVEARKINWRFYLQGRCHASEPGASEEGLFTRVRGRGILGSPLSRSCMVFPYQGGASGLLPVRRILVNTTCWGTG